MKTFVRLVRRYMLAAAGIVLALVSLGAGILLWMGFTYGVRHQELFGISSSEIADGMIQDEGGLHFGPEHAPEEWMRGYEWAMVLDDEGNILWSYALPQPLNHSYTLSEAVGFARWYLEDYPVFCQIQDYGLFVAAKAPGSLWRYNFWMYTVEMHTLASMIALMAVILVFLIVVSCAVFSWRGTRSLRTVAQGLDILAQGGTVALPTGGFAGEVAEKLNQTSAHLQARNEIIARRDTARTNWIAGVSHDIRTPLALILGWAEQIAQEASLPAEAREKAAGICTQAERLRALIEDLNLTSKLQYGAQPLRRTRVLAGPLLRKMVAQFCDSPLAERCTVEVEQTPDAEHARLEADISLLSRAVDNLLNNAAEHNSGPVRVSITAQREDHLLCWTIADDGAGYPPAVLHALRSGTETDENAPHILGLHIVEQITQAHGGSVVFLQNTSGGAKAILKLPLLHGDE